MCVCVCVCVCVSLSYSTLRATRCVKSPMDRVEKMLPDKFLFVEKEKRTGQRSHEPNQ